MTEPKEFSGMHRGQLVEAILKERARAEQLERDVLRETERAAQYRRERDHAEAERHEMCRHCEALRFESETGKRLYDELREIERKWESDKKTIEDFVGVLRTIAEALGLSREATVSRVVATALSLRARAERLAEAVREGCEYVARLRSAVLCGESLEPGLAEELLSWVTTLRTALARPAAEEEAAAAKVRAFLRPTPDRLACPRCESIDVDNIGDGIHALCMACHHEWAPARPAAEEADEDLNDRSPTEKREALEQLVQVLADEMRKANDLLKPARSHFERLCGYVGTSPQMHMSEWLTKANAWFEKYEAVANACTIAKAEVRTNRYRTALHKLRDRYVFFYDWVDALHAEQDEVYVRAEQAEARIAELEAEIEAQKRRRRRATVSRDDAWRETRALRARVAQLEAVLRDAWDMYKNSGVMREPDGRTGNGKLDRLGSLLDEHAALARSAAEKPYRTADDERADVVKALRATARHKECIGIVNTAETLRRVADEIERGEHACRAEEEAPKPALHTWGRRDIDCPFLVQDEACSSSRCSIPEGMRCPPCPAVVNTDGSEESND